MSLSSEFILSLLDIENEVDLCSLYDLLSMNYVEDCDAIFRLDYSKEFLKWALKQNSLLLGMKYRDQLVGFISASQIKLQNYSSVQIINFLCVHKNFRYQHLASILIKEMKRRIDSESIGIYTSASSCFPNVISTYQYYHRPLNPMKLIKTGFMSVDQHITQNILEMVFKLPNKSPSLRKMHKSDIPAVTKLLNNYLTKFDLTTIFTEEDVCHWLLPKEGVIYSYVDDKITQFGSFYSLPSRVLSNNKHISVAYLYYYVPKDNINSLINDLLIYARSLNFDVFTCLNNMENNAFITQQKFVRGDGDLFYYSSSPLMKPKTIGLQFF